MTAKVAIRLLIVLAAGLSTPAAMAADGAASEVSAIERWKADPTTVFAASDVDLAAFKWVARPVIVFADAPVEPAFGRQIELLQSQMAELTERDVVVIVDADPEAQSDIRRELRPRGFTLTLIGKDGRVVLRKPFPWDVRELSRSIDKQPIRKQELKEKQRSE